MNSFLSPFMLGRLSPKTAFDPNAGWVPGYLRGVFIAKKLGGAPSVRAQAHAELALSPAFFLLLKKRGVLDFQAALICSTSHAPGRKWCAPE